MIRFSTLRFFICDILINHYLHNNLFTYCINVWSCIPIHTITGSPGVTLVNVGYEMHFTGVSEDEWARDARTMFKILSAVMSQL